LFNLFPQISQKLLKLENVFDAEYEKHTVDVKMPAEEECFHILDLLDKIMISLNEIPWESITLIHCNAALLLLVSFNFPKLYSSKMFVFVVQAHYCLALFRQLIASLYNKKNAFDE